VNVNTPTNKAVTCESILLGKQFPTAINLKLNHYEIRN